MTMNPRYVHPLCHMWPEEPEWRFARLMGDGAERMRKQARNKRKAWRQRRRGRK